MKHLSHITLVSLIAMASHAPVAIAQGCKANAAWFTATAPPGTSEPPADSECAFYQRSWEMFIWLTAEDSATHQPRFIGFTTPDELFVKPKPPGPSPSDQPLTLLSKIAKTSRLTISAKDGAVKRLGMGLRLAKNPMEITADRPEIDAGVIQAGSKGAVVDSNGRTLYFAQHVDPVFEAYVKQHHFDQASNLAAAKPDDAFPPGSIELKSSWRVKQPNETGNGFIMVKATVPKLVKDHQNDNDIIVSLTETRDEDMLLVGLHVVFVTVGHPEFVWATFEHKDNAPDLGGPGQGTGAATATGSPAPVDSTRSYTFYKQGTPAKECNIAGTLTGTGLGRLTLNEADQTLQPVSNIFREFRFGGEPTPEDEIIDLNDDVHRLTPQGSPIASYILIGALWMNEPTMKPFRAGLDFGDIGSELADRTRFAGETKLSNATMETFTQTENNCFSCHDTKSKRVGANLQPFPATLLGVSHILRDAYKADPRPNP